MGRQEGNTIRTDQSSIDMIVVSFEHDDKQDPHNWKTVRNPSLPLELWDMYLRQDREREHSLYLLRCWHVSIAAWVLH